MLFYFGHHIAGGLQGGSIQWGPWTGWADRETTLGSRWDRWGSVWGMVYTQSEHPYSDVPYLPLLAVTNARKRKLR